MTHAPHITLSAVGGPVGTPRATSPRLSRVEPRGFQPVRHPLPKLCARRPSLAVGAAFCRGVFGSGRSCRLGDRAPGRADHQILWMQELFSRGARA